MDVYRTLAALKINPPNMGQELLTCESAPPVGHEKPNQLKLSPGQFQLYSSQRGRPAQTEIEPHPREDQRVPLLDKAPPKEGDLHPLTELLRVMRGEDKVIDQKAQIGVMEVVACNERNDRQPRDSRSPDILKVPLDKP